MRRFGPSNEPGSCLYCSRVLKPALGPYGDGCFCTLDCAASFGRGAARLGFRFKPLTAEQLEARKQERREARSKQRADAKRANEEREAARAAGKQWYGR